MQYLKYLMVYLCLLLNIGSWANNTPTVEIGFDTGNYNGTSCDKITNAVCSVSAIAPNERAIQHQQYALSGQLSVDQHGRLVLQIPKNNATQARQQELLGDGYLYIPKNLELSQNIKTALSIHQPFFSIRRGYYAVIEWEDHFLILLE